MTDLDISEYTTYDAFVRAWHTDDLGDVTLDDARESGLLNEDETRLLWQLLGQLSDDEVLIEIPDWLADEKIGYVDGATPTMFVGRIDRETEKAIHVVDSAAARPLMKLAHRIHHLEDGGDDSEQDSVTSGPAAGPGGSTGGGGGSGGVVTEPPEGDDTGDSGEAEEGEDGKDDEEEQPESPEIEEPETEPEDDIDEPDDTDEDVDEDADDQEDEDEEEEDDVLVVVQEVGALSAMSWGVQSVMKHVEECYGEEIELFYKPVLSESSRIRIK